MLLLIIDEILSSEQAFLKKTLNNNEHVNTT